MKTICNSSVLRSLSCFSKKWKNRRGWQFQFSGGTKSSVSNTGTSWKNSNWSVFLRQSSSARSILFTENGTLCNVRKLLQVHWLQGEHRCQAHLEIRIWVSYKLFNWWMSPMGVQLSCLMAGLNNTASWITDI